MARRRVRLRSVLPLLLGIAAAALATAAPGAHAAASAPALSAGGMVASPQRDATAAGVEILEAGGNAVDAAVATAFALAVTDPHHSGIGGGGFILVRTAEGRVFAVDARETAPAAATRDMFVRPGVAAQASRLGGLAVATPGLVRGLAETLERHGTLPLARVMAPAIRLAEQGFAVGPGHAAAVRYWQGLGLAARFPETARIQLPADGSPIDPGFRLVQHDLARTLRAIAEHGPGAFYGGPVAESIAKAVREHGGILTQEDLAGYTTRWREPVRGSYRGTEVFSFPPPSSGGVALVETLNLLEPLDLAALGPGSSATVHHVAEAMKLAFADRAALLGDPDFAEVPVAELVSKDYAARQRRRLATPWWRSAPWRWGRERAARIAGPGLAVADGGTTHLSVTDAAGGAVAITQTVNLLFGSGITAPGTGVVLNNEMDDFSVALDTPNAFGLVDTRGANAVAPGKRPLSSMTPTILARDGRVFMVIGSPGGPRIISTTLLSVLHVIDHGMDVQAAVAERRYHHQWIPDELVVEPGTPADVLEALRERGHAVTVSTREWSSAQAVVVDPESGLHQGGSDPRGDGVARGPAGPGTWP